MKLRQRTRKLHETEVEPRAYLRTIQNVHPGLISRTRVIRALGDDWMSATKISKETGLSYKVVTYHMRLMENENVVTHRSQRPKLWGLTGLGQQRIIEPGNHKK
jgi:DNA-binding transcriptional ArsR family regulator